MSTTTNTANKADTKPVAMQTKKAPYESNLKASERLFKEQSNEEEILKHYVAAYKSKGKSDKEWIKKRAQIYMKIAERKASK